MVESLGDKVGDALSDFASFLKFDNKQRDDLPDDNAPGTSPNKRRRRTSSDDFEL